MFKRQEKDTGLANSILHAMNHDQENLDTVEGASKKLIQQSIKSYKNQLKKMGYQASLGSDGYWRVR